MKNMYVYIMTNKNNTTLYIGVTNNLVRRVWEHKNKITKGFTTRYNINKLVYFESCESEISAISREKALKDRSRQYKNDIISKMNPDWVDLYDSIC